MPSYNGRSRQSEKVDVTDDPKKDRGFFGIDDDHVNLSPPRQHVTRGHMASSTAMASLGLTGAPSALKGSRTSTTSSRVLERRLPRLRPRDLTELFYAIQLLLAISSTPRRSSSYGSSGKAAIA
jgi:hypothetical protein